MRDILTRISWISQIYIDEIGAVPLFRRRI